MNGFDGEYSYLKIDLTCTLSTNCTLDYLQFLFESTSIWMPSNDIHTKYAQVRESLKKHLTMFNQSAINNTKQRIFCYSSSRPSDPRAKCNKESHLCQGYIDNNNNTDGVCRQDQETVPAIQFFAGIRAKPTMADNWIDSLFNWKIKSQNFSYISYLCTFNECNSPERTFELYDIIKQYNYLMSFLMSYIDSEETSITTPRTTTRAFEETINTGTLNCLVGSISTVILLDDTSINFSSLIEQHFPLLRIRNQLSPSCAVSLILEYHNTENSSLIMSLHFYPTRQFFQTHLLVRIKYN